MTIYNAISQATAFSFNATGPTGPANLSFPIYPNVNTAFEATVNLTGGTGGVRVGVQGPSGVQITAQVYGVSTGTNGISVQLTQPTFTSSVFNYGAGGVVGPLLVVGLAVSATGVTGSAQIIFGGMAATGPTGTIGTGSYLMTWPIV